MRAFLVDDEPLALSRLRRLLEDAGGISIAGASSDPVEAIEQIRKLIPDVLFLDIQMPEVTGFDLLKSLDPQPLVVFTTAYHQYALQAFEVNSVDYLLKPIEPQQLERALAKLERMRGEPRPDLHELMQKLTAALHAPAPASQYPERLASRTGERVEFIELASITHIFAQDKLTYAATAKKNYCIDQTIVELEAKLDPRKFVRIHRSTMVNTDYVQELYTFFAGRMLLRLKDEKKTELTVARDRVKELKTRLGL
jgi:two-component system, LytTR family, response regulator